VPARTEQTRIEHHGSVGQVAGEAWDRLAGANPHARHGWLKVVERCFIGGVVPNYITAWQAGELVAATVGYSYPRTDRVDTVDNVLLGRLRPFATAIGISFLPALVAGPLYSTGVHILVSPAVDARLRRRLIAQLLDALEREADAAACSLFLPGVTERETELIAALRERGYLRVAEQPIAVLDIEWESFAAYVDSLRGRNKRIWKNVKLQRNRQRRDGVEIRLVDDVAACEECLHRLLDQHTRRLTGRSFMFNASFCGALQEHLGKDARLYAAYKNGAISGLCIALRAGAETSIKFVAVDHALAADFTYFNLCYHHPIEEAIGSETGRIDFGRGGYPHKLRRGCRLEDAALYWRPRGAAQTLAARPWCRLVSLVNDRKWPRAARTGRVLRA